jgi:hypothetical protein
MASAASAVEAIELRADGRRDPGDDEDCVEEHPSHDPKHVGWGARIGAKNWAAALPLSGETPADAGVSALAC